MKQDKDLAFQAFADSIFPAYLGESLVSQQLLWHREKLEVLEPQSVREEMKRIIQDMLKQYQDS